MKTKLFLLISGILLLFTSFSMAAAMRDINAIGEIALKSGAISAPPIDHDFNVIPTGAKYHPNRLLVRFEEKKDGGQHTSIEKLGILQSVDGSLKIRREYQLVPGLVCIEIPDGMKLEKILRALNKTEGILYAEPDYEVTIATLPNDSYFNYLWGLHNTGQNGGTVDADIDAPEAWDTTTGNADIVVAVIDTGVDYTHSDLAANMWHNPGEIPNNGIDDDGDGFIDDYYGYDFCNNDGNPWDDNGHGTHCSGTIGAVGNNSTGVVGVCWNVKIMAIKFLNASGNGTDSDAIDSIQYSVLMGANLSSNSWGGDTYNQSLKNAINTAGTAGMLFVAAAGNNSSNNDTNPFYPASYTCSNIISVLSTNNNDNLSNFSNYGANSVDIGAPGGQSPSGTNDDIYSTVPGGYAFYCGTSMATPHVSGACALLLSINPSLTYQQIKSIILDTRDYNGSLNGLCVSTGRLNVHTAVHDYRVWQISAISYFYDSSGDVTAWFDKTGNLVLSGMLSQQNPCNQTGVTGQKIRNSNGTAVVAVINSSTGDMYIAGSCFENQSSLNPTNAAYVVKDSNGNVVAYISTSGNLYLKGRVYESI